MLAVLANGKYNCLTTCAISGECFASLLSCGCPLLLRWHPGNRHCKAVQKTVAQLSVFKDGLLTWGRETEAVFQHAVLPGSSVLKPEHDTSYFSLRSFSAAYTPVLCFVFHSEEGLFGLYSAKLVCETKSTKQYWIPKQMKWKSKLLMRE